jgi:PHP domain-containing protein
MRADLHVHSIHSGARHYRRAGMKDCYAKPGEVYDAARAAGMGLVTLTDRDTIEGCLRLLDERGDLPDFVFGEEVEARIPDSRLRVHVGVWGIEERQHAEIVRLRDNVENLASFLRTERIACGFNHFVGALPVDLPSADVYWRILNLFDGLEVRNGAQGRRYNALVSALAVGEAARRSPVAFIGGSDAHTLRRVGVTWTEADASSRDEFLDAIRNGRTAAGGRVGRPADVVHDFGALTLSHYAALWESVRRRGGRGVPAREALRAAVALPVQAVGVPLVGAAVYFWRLRSQVRALQREIAGLDLLEFRRRMSSFPRTDPEAGASPPGGADGVPGHARE